MATNRLPVLKSSFELSSRCVGGHMVNHSGLNCSATGSAVKSSAANFSLYPSGNHLGTFAARSRLLASTDSMGLNTQPPNPVQGSTVDLTDVESNHSQPTFASADMIFMEQRRNCERGDGDGGWRERECIVPSGCSHNIICPQSIRNMVAAITYPRQLLTRLLYSSWRNPPMFGRSSY